MVWSYYHPLCEAPTWQLPYIPELEDKTGYGIATAGYGAMDGIKKVNNQAALQKIERILDNITINAPTADASGN